MLLKIALLNHISGLVMDEGIKILVILNALSEIALILQHFQTLALFTKQEMHGRCEQL